MVKRIQAALLTGALVGWALQVACASETNRKLCISLDESMAHIIEYVRYPEAQTLQSGYEYFELLRIYDHFRIWELYRRPATDGMWEMAALGTTILESSGECYWSESAGVNARDRLCFTGTFYDGEVLVWENAPYRCEQAQ